MHDSNVDVDASLRDEYGYTKDRMLELLPTIPVRSFFSFLLSLFPSLSFSLPYPFFHSLPTSSLTWEFLTYVSYSILLYNTHLDPGILGSILHSSGVGSAILLFQAFPFLFFPALFSMFVFGSYH